MKISTGLLEKHPDFNAALEIVQRLNHHGYEAYFAGGAVRDLLLSRQPHDIDVATSARPEQVESIFSKTIDVGKAFGVIRVLDFGADIEVASFRKDGVYADGRRPESVEFSDAKEDCLRRDFTMNALFYNPMTSEVIDFVGGMDDIQAQVIRAVGNPSKRFLEDHLRILRAVRFYAQLGFSIDTGTMVAVGSHAALVATVSWERIQAEFEKIFLGPFAERALGLLQELKILEVLFPNKKLCLKIPSGASIKQAWVWFLSPWLEQGVTRKDFAGFKFSSELTQALVDAGAMLQDRNKVYGLSWGEQILYFQKQGAFLALELCAQREDPLAVEFIRKLKEQGFTESLPPAWVTGEDLKMHLSGPALGGLLKKIYCLQLEGQFENAQAAKTEAIKRAQILKGEFK